MYDLCESGVIVEHMAVLF